MVLETDESSGPFVPPLLVLFWTHPCTPESPLRLAMSKSPRRFGHLAFSPLNPSNVCDCSPWSLGNYATATLCPDKKILFRPAVEKVALRKMTAKCL